MRSPQLEKLHRSLIIARQQVLQLPSAGRMLVALILGATLLAFFAVALKISSWWFLTASHIHSLEPEIARLRGLIESRERISSTLEQRRALLEDLTFNGIDGTGRNGALLQQELRRLASASGLTLIGSEVKDANPSEHMSMLFADLKATGTPQQLLKFLDSINTARPALFLESFSMTGRRQLSGRLRDSTQLTDSVLIVDMSISSFEAPMGL